MTRSAAREIAVRLCFSAEMMDNGTDNAADVAPVDFVGDFFEPEHYATLGKEDALYAERPTEEQMNYIRNLVSLVTEHQEELDGHISRHAKGWSLNRISRVSLAVMRCAICEILYLDDVPTATAIDEAVEIAKRYEEPETVSFINGVLGGFVRETREQA